MVIFIILVILVINNDCIVIQTMNRRFFFNGNLKPVTILAIIHVKQSTTRRSTFHTNGTTTTNANTVRSIFASGVPLWRQAICRLYLALFYRFCFLNIGTDRSIVIVLLAIAIAVQNLSQ